MIGFIRGVLAEAWNRSCLLLTSGGVGYELALPAHTFSALPPKGSEVEFYTSLAVREDALELFGFETFEEKQAFELLTGISKVGSRTALAILSLYRPQQLQDLVASGDVTALTKVSGIGQKTSQHIFLELKYKLGQLSIRRGAAGAQPLNIPSVLNDVLAALANLGYSEEEALIVAKDVLDAEPDLDVGSAIRQTLKALARGRS